MKSSFLSKEVEIVWAVPNRLGHFPEPGDTELLAGAGTTYPLKNCVVSGEELGSMGEPVSIKHDGREVKFCCKGSVDEFKAEPQKYLAKLIAAEAGSAVGYDTHPQGVKTE